MCTMTNPFRVTMKSLNISTVLVTLVRNQQVLVRVISEGSAFCLFPLFFHTHTHTNTHTDTHTHIPQARSNKKTKATGKKNRKWVLTSCQSIFTFSLNKQIPKPNPIKSLNVYMGSKGLEPCNSGGWRIKRNRLDSIPVSLLLMDSGEPVCVCLPLSFN